MPVVAAGGAIVVALMAVLLCLAAALSIRSIAEAVPDWHIPGFSSIRGWVISQTNNIININIGIFDRYIRPLADFVLAPVAAAVKMLNANYAFAVQIYHAVVHLQKVLLVGAIRVLRAEAANGLRFAETLITQAIALAEARLLAVERLLQGLVASAVAELRLEAANGLHFVENLLLGAVAVLRAEAANGLRFAENLVTQAIALAEARLVRAVALLTAALTAGLAAADRRMDALAAAAARYAEQVAVAAATAAIAGLNRVLVTDITTPWTKVQEGVAGVIDVAADDFADIVQDLKDIDLSVPKDIAAAIAGTAAIAIPLLKLAKDCTMPNCRNLSQVGRDLQALFGVVEGGALIAMLGAAAADPSGFAHDFQSTVGAVIGDARDLAESEIGVH